MLFKAGRTLLLVSLLSLTVSTAQTRMTIPVQVQRPPEVTLSGIGILAVFDFDVAEGIDTTVGSELARKFRDRLLENGHYKLVGVEWRPMQLVSEYGYGELEELFREAYQILGENTGADGLFLGTVETYSSHDEGGPRTKKTTITRTAEIGVRCQIIDAWKASLVAELSQDVQEKDSSTQQKKLTPAEVLFDRALDKLAENLTKTIAPYTSDETRTLEADGHKLIVRGYDFAIRDLWADAKGAWEGVLNDETAANVHPRAWYNLGIYYEVTGDVDNSKECFDKAYELKEDDLYLNARTRIKKRKTG